MKRGSPEQKIHTAIVGYLRTVLPHGFIVHHSRNGGKSIEERRKAKEMGAVSGWPDLEILGVTDTGPRAWFMEVKPPKVYAKPHQTDLHDRIQDIGFDRPVVVRSIEDARAACLRWGLPLREVRSAPALVKTEGEP